jgi:hypothetical protein
MTPESYGRGEKKFLARDKREFGGGPVDLSNRKRIIE